MKRYLKLGAFTIAVLGLGFLIGTGAIGDLLNIGESTLAAGSTRSDTEEYRAESERIQAESERLRVEGDAAVAQAEREIAEQRAAALQARPRVGGGSLANDGDE